MNKIYAALIIIVLSVFAGCSSNIGGTLTGFDKNTVPGALVRLIVIDDEGDELEEVSSIVTDDKGNFDLGYRGIAGSSFIVEAVLPEGRIRGFAAGNGGRTDLNPITDALVTSILYITGGGGAVGLSDFSRNEIENIVGGVEQNSDLWNLDFRGSETLIDGVIATAGMLIPEAAGGSVAGVPLASVEAPNEITDDDPTFLADPAHPCVRDNYWTESSLFGFDVLQDGALCRSNSDTLGLYSAYDIAYQLEIEGDNFEDTGNGSFPGNGGVDVPDVFVEDDREICFGPVLTENGLSVTRKVYIPEIGDFARYLEIFSNPTGSDRTIDIKINGSLGIGEFVIYGTGILTLLEQNGDLIIGSGDNYAASIASTPNMPHPTVGYVWDGLSGEDSADYLSFAPSNSTQSFSYYWNDVTIPSGGTKVFIHYAYLSGSQVEAEIENVLKEIYRNPDETGMSTAELSALENFAVTHGNITGETGSVPSNSDLIIANETKALSIVAKARRDGGFAANIDADSGDKVIVEAKIAGTTLAELPVDIAIP